jgi:hypothetical protein
MTTLLLASKLTDARKSSYDALDFDPVRQDQKPYD